MASHLELFSLFEKEKLITQVTAANLSITWWSLLYLLCLILNTSVAAVQVHCFTWLSMAPSALVCGVPQGFCVDPGLASSAVQWVDTCCVVFGFGLLGTDGDWERRGWLAGVFLHAVTCTLPFVLWFTLRPFIILAFEMSYSFSTLRGMFSVAYW